MNQSRLKIEHLLYAAAFLLALTVRLVGANQAALTNREAALALQSLALARGQSTLIGPQPAYLVLTAALMFLFNAGSWVARFWPALAGSLLVLLPALYRDRLGSLPALLLAFFLALDPGLLAASHQAGGLSLALLFTLLAFGLWLKRKTALAGVSAGMALLSGPGVWPGIISLGLALWVASLLNRKEEKPAQTEPSLAEPGLVEPILAEAETLRAQNDPAQAEEEPSSSLDLRRALIFALVTVFFAGTAFFTIPGGLNAMADSIPAYLRGWLPAAQGSAPILPVFVALVVYELFPLFFGIWGAVSGLIGRRPRRFAPIVKDSLDRFLLTWWIIALALVILYPGRQVLDLAWSLLPLWALAARQVTRLLALPADDRLPALGQMVLAAIILGYASMALASESMGVITNPWEFRVRLAGSLVMLAASTGLIAWGWSRRVALRGLSWGLGIILLIYLVSGGWNAVGLSGRAGEELWSGDPKVESADTLLGTLHDLSQIGPVEVGGPDVVVVGVQSPALNWLLRGVERVSYSSQLPAGSSPAVVITSGQPDLAPSATYRGQRFIWSEAVNWAQLDLPDWFRWLAFRSAPAQALQQQSIILWARGDLFPGGSQAQPAGQNSAAPVPPQ